MATIHSPGLIKTLLENSGRYPGDPQINRIYRYAGQNGETLYAVFTDPRLDDIFLSPYVWSPVLLFDTDLGGLLQTGVLELEQLADVQAI